MHDAVGTGIGNGHVKSDVAVSGNAARLGVFLHGLEGAVHGFHILGIGMLSRLGRYFGFNQRTRPHHF